MAVFYEPNLQYGVTFLSEEESKHCAIVLRHEICDEIFVMDGEGTIVKARLTQANKKKCEFEELSRVTSARKPFRVHLAIAPTKNVDRMEWMLEKLGEIGVDEISFLKTENSERTKIRIDRLEKKALSAMKQSKHPFLLKINELVSLEKFIDECGSDEKWIAQVGDHPYLANQIAPKKKTTVLIGPEGDFSTKELDLAVKHGFQPVSLGKTTLRTETAGLMACHFVNIINGF